MVNFKVDLSKDELISLSLNSTKLAEILEYYNSKYVVHFQKYTELVEALTYLSTNNYKDGKSNHIIKLKKLVCQGGYFHSAESKIFIRDHFLTDIERGYDIYIHFMDRLDKQVKTIYEDNTLSISSFAVSSAMNDFLKKILSYKITE